MKLTPVERECILTIADDETDWHIFTDSARLTRRLLRLAARWGVAPERCGEGWEFTLPLAAVRFVGPLRVTERQRAARREALQKARLSLKNPVPVEAAEGSRREGVS